jgi:hypothetical protein
MFVWRRVEEEVLDGAEDEEEGVGLERIDGEFHVRRLSGES